MKQRNWVVRTISDTLCDWAGLSWQYIVRWKPLVCRGQPWTRYGVSGYKCMAHAAACTATVCAAAMTLCLLEAGGSNVTAIAADLPERTSAVRIGTAFKPKNCLAQPISGTLTGFVSNSLAVRRSALIELLGERSAQAGPLLGRYI